MAGEWIKMRAQLLQSPKLLAMSRALHAHRQFREWLIPGGGGAANGQVVSDDALRCVTCALLLRVWSAAREFGKFDGDDLVLDGIEVRDIDTIAGCFGVGESMVAVGWAEFEQGALVLPKFKQHNAPMTNAERQSEFRRRRKPPDLETEEDDYALHERNACAVTTPLPDERRREENQSSKDGRKTLGNKSTNCQASLSSRSSKETHVEKVGFKADLSGVDWSRVVAMAEAVGRYVKPVNDRDRRSWLKFGVLADTAFSEAWLMSAAESASRSNDVRKSRQAYFVAALKTKAREQYGIDEPNFTAIVKRIEIPAEVWHSPALEV